MADESKDPQTVTGGTVDDLKTHLDTIDSHDDLDALKRAEAAGKDRATAYAAIEARRAVLSDSGDAQDANVTKAPADDDAKADPNAEVDAEKPVTVLAEVPHPEALSDGDINDITAGGLSDDVDGPRSDAANALTQARDEARGVEVERSYLHGMGPGADIG